MPRIILKSNYLKTTSNNASGFLKYIATRDGVVKYTNDQKLLPATEKQKKMITKMLSEVPDSNSLFEYEDYLKNPNRDNASSFLSSCADYYFLNKENANPEIYTEYIATRPNSEKINTHGLFGTEDNISLKNAMEEMKNHKGNIWTHIISLRREDAERLGFNNVNSWENLVRSKTIELAKYMKIKPNDLVWYGAFHNESHHPHIHLMVYSKKGDGYLTKQGINSLRSSFAKTIFKQDLIQIYEKQTLARDGLKKELISAIEELQFYIQSENIKGEPLTSKFLSLTKSMEHHKGRKFYAYLSRDLKSQVDEVLDLFLEVEVINKCFNEWLSHRKDIMNTYQDVIENTGLKLSEVDEFKSLKNVIIKNTVECNSPPAPELKISSSEIDLLELPNPTLEITDDIGNSYSAEFTIGKRTSSLWTNSYKHCKDVLFKEKDFVKAFTLYKIESEKNNPLAIFDLARLYQDGLGTEKDLNVAFKLYQKALELFIQSYEEKKSDYLEYRIGKMYLYGLGTDKEYEQAKNWFRLSSDAGNKYAQYSLGMMYKYGTGGEPDMERALDLLLQSADSENPYAEYQYGYYYKNSNDFNELKTSKKYLSRAFKNFSKLEMDSEDDKLSFKVGNMLEHGIGTEKNIDDAIKYFLKAEQLNNSDALIRLIKYYADQEPLDGNELNPRIEKLKKIADDGNESAIFFYAKLLGDGKVVAKDEVTAISYYSQIADENSNASYRLGKLLIEPSQVPLDIENGIYWLEKSAKNNNANALYQLGNLYLKGELVSGDITKAVSCLERAVELKNEPASFLLGNLYSNGGTVPEDHQKAFHLFKMYSDTNMYSAYSLGRLILKSEHLDIDKNMGIYYLERSLELGNENSYNALGYLYLKGDIVSQDIEKAIYYFERSAEKNDSSALYQLARIYLYGVGTAKNEQLGMQYLLSSANLGNTSAEQLLFNYNTPPVELALKNSLNAFLPIFKQPPSYNSSKGQESIVDRKLKSKIKRKKLALGHKEDGHTMKG